MVLDDTLLDVCDVGDDDKLQSHAVKLRGDSMDHRLKAATDPRYDCFLSTTVVGFVPTEDAPLDRQAAAGQRSIKSDDARADLDLSRASGTTSDVARGENCSSLSCQLKRQNCPNLSLAMPFEAFLNGCVCKEDAEAVMEVQCMCLTFDSGQHQTGFDPNLDRVICDLAANVGFAAVAAAAGKDGVPAAVGFAPAVLGP